MTERTHLLNLWRLRLKETIKPIQALIAYLEAIENADPKNIDTDRLMVLVEAVSTKTDQPLTQIVTGGGLDEIIEAVTSRPAWAVSCEYDITKSKGCRERLAAEIALMKESSPTEAARLEALLKQHYEGVTS